MAEVRLSLTTVVALAAVVGAGAFAAGRATTSHATPSAEATPLSAPVTPEPGLPPGHPPADLPPGHPPASDLPPGHPPLGAEGAPSAAPAEVAALEWKAPARWQAVPNASSMRLATYRIPRAEGDAQDPELSVTQAGGSVDANVERWIGQFGEEGRKTAKRTTRKIAGLDVTIVEVEGTFAGGMGAAADAEKGWALLGAIVSTPGMPHFFKMTGPAKSVKAARAELDELLGSLSTR